MTKTLAQALYERFLLPLNRPCRDWVGIEIELPVVNLAHRPVNFEICHLMMNQFVNHFHFAKKLRDEDGHIYNALSEDSGDAISFDCSYNTLEFSFAPEENLHLIFDRFTNYYTFCKDLLNHHHHTLTGMGINPHLDINHNIPIHNDRYRMLFHHLNSYEKYGSQIPFHSYPNFGLFSCATQVQLDTDLDHFDQVLNTFTLLEPIKAILTANSMIPGRPEKLLARDDLWEFSLHGLNRHNIGMFETEIHSEAEMIHYLESMSVYCVTKGDKYINFPPTPLIDYMNQTSMTGEYFDRHRQKYITIQFEPELSDLGDLRSFKFEDLTYRGTIEFRSTCTQPVKEAFTNAALHTGLIRKMPQLKHLLQNDTVIYHHGYSAAELRRLFQMRIIPSFVNQKQLRELLRSILDLAAEGLAERGHGEQIFLKPLYQRASMLMSPAREMAEGLEKGLSLDHFILKFGEL